MTPDSPVTPGEVRRMIKDELSLILDDLQNEIRLVQAGMTAFGEIISHARVMFTHAETCDLRKTGRWHACTCPQDDSQKA